MKSSAPWSVKGIERDARETAKEAAKREGMTVGEWLNQVIYSAGDGASSGGEVEGLKLRDLVTAIEHLHKRLAETDVRSADALGDLTRKMGGVVERVQRLERVKPAEGGASAGDYDGLAARLDKLEKSGGDRHRVDALKALEKAVSQAAVQFDAAQKTTLERLDTAEGRIQNLAARVEELGDADEDASGVGFLKDAIDGLSARIARAERIAGEAAKLKEQAFSATDPEFVERTGERLRVLGDEIKRGGDQIRALETAIAKMSEQIEAAERRSAEGVQKVADTVSTLREAAGAAEGRPDDLQQIAEAAAQAVRQHTDEHMSALQRAVDTVSNRLDAMDARAPEQPFNDDSANDDSGDDNDAVAPLAFDIDADDSLSRPAGDADKAEALFSSLDADLDPDDGADNGTEDGEDPFAFDDEPAQQKAHAETRDEAGALLGPEGGDDFAFDLDDDENAAASDDVRSKGEAGDLLAEVQNVFGKKKPPQPEDAESGPRSTDDLDDILADLDELTSSASAAAEEDAAQARSAADADALKAMLSDAPAESRAQEAGEDEDAAPPAADKDALAASPGARPTRRNLTAKQKAILAARARQKRKAAAAQAGAEGPAPGKEPVGVSRMPETQDEDENDGGLSAKMSSALSALTGRFSKNKKPSDAPEEDASADDETDPQSQQGGDRAAMATLKATAAARPLTLALAVAIMLAVTALFFLVKDIVFRPDASAPRASAPASLPAAEPSLASAAPANPALAQPEAARMREAATGAAPQPSAGSAVEPVAASAMAVEGPVLNPRNVYLESIAALNSAADEEAAANAIRKLEEAAALGHPPAQLQLGELYKTGQGVQQDLGQARVWFRRAANGGNVLAMHRIGVMTARGDGGSANPEEAIIWFERAANHGLVDSQYNLGAVYHPTSSGGAPLQDASKAYYWYSLAARNGDQQAAPLAAGVASLLSDSERRTIETSVGAWREQPRDQDANELAAG